MFKGIGDPMIISNLRGTGLPSEQWSLGLCLTEFIYASEATKKEARCFNSEGELRTASSTIGVVDDTLTFTMEEQTWGQLGFALNRLPNKTLTENLVIPVSYYATVPATSPYEIDISTGYSSGDEDYVYSQITQRGTWGEVGELEQATSAPGDGEYQVDVGTPGSEKIVFNVAQASAPILYTLPTTYTAGQSYGGPGSARVLGTFSFYGILRLPTSSNGWRVYFPQVNIESRPTVTINDGVPTLTVTASPSTPSGWSEPFTWLNLDTAS